MLLFAINILINHFLSIFHYFIFNNIFYRTCCSCIMSSRVLSRKVKLLIKWAGLRYKWFSKLLNVHSLIIIHLIFCKAILIYWWEEWKRLRRWLIKFVSYGNDWFEFFLCLANNIVLLLSRLSCLTFCRGVYFFKSLILI